MGKKKVLDQDCEMKVDKKEKKTEHAVCDDGAEKAVQKSSSHEKKKKKKDKQVESPTQHDKKGGTKQDKKSKKSKAVEDVIIIEDEDKKKSPSSKKKKKKQDTQVEAVLSTKGDSPLTDKIKPKKSKTRKETEDVTVIEHAGIQEELAKKTKKASRKERKKEKSSAAVEEGDKTKKSKKSTKKKKGKDATVVDDDEPSSKIKEADPSVVAESLETPDGLQNGSDAKQKKKSRKRKSTEDKVENAEVESESQETSTKKRKKEKEKQCLSHSEDGTTHAKDEGGKSKKKKKKQKDDKSHSAGDVEKLDKTERKKQKEKNLKKSESTSDMERPKKKKKKKPDLSDSIEKKPSKTDSDIKDSMINPKSSSKTDVKSEKKAKKRKYKEIEEVKEDKQPSSSEPKAKKDKKKEKKKNTKDNAENREHVNNASSLITVKQEVNEEKVPSKRKRKSSESWDYGKYTNNGKTKQYGSVEYTNVGFNYDNSGDDNVTVVSVKEGNPDGLGELEREKRRELQKEVETVTGKREDEQKEKIKGTESPTPIVKTGQWSTASLGSVERQQKFFRLLGGMKSTPDKDNQSSATKKTPLGHNQSPLTFKKSTSQSNFSSGSPHSRMAMDKSEESSVNKMLETQFQTAMDRKVTKGKVSGLGYIAQEDPKTKSFFIDKNASKSIKFDD